VYHTNLHSVQELQVEMKLLLKRPHDNFVVRMKDLISNMCSHEDHMHTNS